MELKTLEFLEIDVPFCALRYGVTCPASGGEPCYNTRNNLADCQAPEAYTETVKTIRLGKDNGHLGLTDIECIPNLSSLRTSGARVQPGESIGECATLTAACKNHRHSDNGIDPYVDQRGYNTYEAGTFWGKFRARNPFIENVPVRAIRGFVGQALEEMETEHYILQSMTGPNASGGVAIKGVDFTQFLKSETAQAPAASLGYLPTSITAAATEITLEPVGVGETYPASGLASLGEEEIEFTRVGDTFTLTRGVGAEDHDAEEVFQLALVYEAQLPCDIIHDLAVNYSPLTADYTELDTWQALTNSFANVLYSAKIMKPTAVRTLINEMIQHAGLIIYGDNRRNRLAYDIMRPELESPYTYDGARISRTSFKQTDQPKKRVSQAWVFYNRRSPFKSLEDGSNFYSGVATPAPENNYKTEAIHKIYSRWIPPFSRTVALDVATRKLARGLIPPREFEFNLFANPAGQPPPRLGQIVNLADPVIEDCGGQPYTVKAIVTGVAPTETGGTYTAEEFNMSALILSGPKTIHIDLDRENVNLRAEYDARYNVVETESPIVFIIAERAVVGSVLTSDYALDTGDWPADAVLELRVRGAVAGRGGNGGAGYNPLPVGSNGGPAMLVRRPITIDNSTGLIGGGGGGGGGSIDGNNGAGPTVHGGGGGAGARTGTNGSYSGHTPATLELGADDKGYLYGGDGGNLGQSGDSGYSGPNGRGGTITGYSGGSAGIAIRGVSFVTWAAQGDVRGAMVD